MLGRFKKLSLPKKVAVAGGVFVGLYLFAALTTHLYVRQVLLPRLQTRKDDLQRFELKIISDFKLLNDRPVYKYGLREKNAEHFLSGFILWNGDTAHPLRSIEHTRLVELMKTHRDALSSEASWEKMVSDPALISLDLSWVDQLVAYDHINLETQTDQVYMLGQVEKSNGLGRVSIAAAIPFPEIPEIRFAALARVAQMAQTNKLDEAYDVFHHVGYLLATSDSLSGSLSAASMLETEKTLNERLHANWPPIEDERVLAFRRAAWAWSAIEQLRSSAGLGAFEPYLNRATGACAGSFETVAFSLNLQDYLTPTAPLEFDLTERLAKTTQFQHHLLDVCEHENLKVFLAPIRPEANPLLLKKLKPNIARIPFLRRIYGLELITTSLPNFLTIYELSEREPASK